MLRLADTTTHALAAWLAAHENTCVLVPVGSTEPHGPHLPLATDVIISEGAARRAAPRLGAEGIATAIAPSVPYGVTDYAAGFRGAIGVPASVLTPFLHALGARLIADGFGHVCFVNNHLEPAHDKAVRDAIVGLAAFRASVACPLTRKHARTLSAEFKSGACHAGEYETSLVLAETPALVSATHKSLPTLDISLSAAIATGKATFAEINMHDAYTGAPANATRDEGERMYAKLADMIVDEVTSALTALATAGPASDS